MQVVRKQTGGKLGIRERLENWAEASWWGASGGSATCIGSLEGRYRPPVVEGKDGRVIRPEPDFADAALVNEAWLSMPALLDRLFLKFLYVNNASVGFICRKCKVRANPRYAFDLHRAKLEQQLQDRLQLLAKQKAASDNVDTI